MMCVLCAYMHTFVCVCMSVCVVCSYAYMYIYTYMFVCEEVKDSLG